MTATQTRVLTALAAGAGAVALGVTIAWQHEVRRLTRLDRKIDESYIVSHLAIQLLDLRADLTDDDLNSGNPWACVRVHRQVSEFLDRYPWRIVEAVTNDLGATPIMYERHENYRRITDRLVNAERALREAGHRTTRVYR